MPERAALDTTTHIETPEHIRFEVRIAGPSRRAIAYMLDLLMRALVVLGIAIVAGLAGISSEEFSGMSTGVMLVVMFAVEWGYYVLFESMWSGQTPGKRWTGLRVIKEGGYPITFLDVVIRNLLRAADFLPTLYIVGVSVMAADSRFRRLGDLAAGTIVVAEERSFIGTALVIRPPPTEQELLAVPADPGLSGADVDAIESFLRRVGTLSPMRESELAEMVAPLYARRLNLRYQSAARFLALLYHRATSGMAGTNLAATSLAGADISRSARRKRSKPRRTRVPRLRKGWR